MKKLLLLELLLLTRAELLELSIRTTALIHAMPGDAVDLGIARANLGAIRAALALRGHGPAP